MLSNLPNKVACASLSRQLRAGGAITTQFSTVRAPSWPLKLPIRGSVFRTTSSESSSRRFSRPMLARAASTARSEEHTSELQSRLHLVCRLLLEKKKELAEKAQAEHDQM